MKFLAVSLLLAALAVAKPLPEPSLVNGFTKTSLSASTIESDNAIYTADIDTTDKSAPPPLWDPPTPPPPPLFEAPKEDLPLIPSWLLSVHEAPVQSVRVEKLAPFTPAKVQPVDNIYAPSSSDEEGNFNGEGSLRPGHRSFGACIVSFVSSWFWWISVVVLAAVVVYVAEKMLIGSVKAARKARSASRVARSRAASLMQGTRSRAASILGDSGRGRSATLLEKPVWRIERSPSPPVRNRSWDDSMV